MYTEKVMEHFLNPKNVGVIEDADGVGEAGNIVCGDLMRIYIKVEVVDGKEIIKDIKFRTLGCAAAIAASSMITEMAKGKSIEDALKITNQDVANELGGLPKIKMHCSVLAADALKEAIYDYLQKNEKDIPEFLEKEHQRIERARVLVEEKYGEFVEAERRAMEE